MIKLFLFLLYFFVVVDSETYDCIKKNIVELKENEIAFFETSKYPNLWSYDILKLDCNLTFTVPNNEKNLRLFVSYSMIANDSDGHNNADYSKVSYGVNTFTIFSLFQYKYQSSLAAVQGFLIFDDKNEVNSCPMESVTKPFKFVDETQILFIQSSYEEFFYRNFSCHWQFSAPFGYALKIIVQIFDSSSIFRIENSTDVLANERSVQTFHPYYNDDNFIQISLYPNNSTFSYQMEFRAHISVIKKLQTKIDGNCTITEYTDNRIIWTNVDKNKGYENNVYCIFELVIPSNTEVFVNMEDELEKGGDYIKYFPDSNNDIKFVDDKSFIIQAHYNGQNRSIFWEFVSDGSYQLLGFWIFFQKMECECADNLLKCDNNTHGIMKNDYLSYYTCGNLQCNFTIEPCNTSLTAIEIVSYDNKDDTYKIISNNVTVLTIYSFNKTFLYTAYLNSSQINYFIVDTFPSADIKTMTVSIKPFIMPKITSNFVLSMEIPSVVIDTTFNNFFTIEILPELHNMNLTIFIYCSYLCDKFQVFNNESLTYILNCFDGTLPYACAIQSNKIAIYVKDPFSVGIVVTELSNQSTGCIFKMNTFRITDEKSIASVANFKEYCDITLLVLENYFYMTLWTTAVRESVKIYAGTDFSKLFLEFTSSSAKTWNQVILNTDVYKIRIPKGAAILFYFKKTGKCDDDICYLISQHPFKSIFSTPHYGLSEISDVDLRFNITNVSTKITAIDYFNNASELIYFADANTNQEYVINKLGDFVIFQNQYLSFSFEGFDNLDFKRGALFFIETLDNDKFIL